MLASTYDCMSCYENFAIMLHLHTCMYAYTQVQAFAPIIVHTCGKHIVRTYMDFTILQGVHRVASHPPHPSI